MHFIFVYFVHSGFRTKIKCILKIQSTSENPQPSAAERKFHAYEGSGVPRIRKFSTYEIFWIYSICFWSTTFEVNTDHDCMLRRWHFRCRARYLCKKSMHALFSRSFIWWSRCATLLVLRPLQMLQICPHIFQMRSCYNHHLAKCSLDFRSTRRALFKVLSAKSNTKRRKNEGRSKH